VLDVYQRDTARLLRDRQNLSYSLAELTDYINQARRELVRATGCLRCLIAGNSPFGSGSTPGLAIPGGMTPGSPDTSLTVFQTIPGQEKYHYGYANPLLQQLYSGVSGVLDVIAVAVNWGGSMRPVDDWLPWEYLQAYARSYSVGVFNYPFLWSTYGDGVNGQVWLFPTPGTQCEMQWDVTPEPAPIYSNTDYEAIPSPFTEGVKFFAARQAFLASQRYGAADLMFAEFDRELGLDRAASDRGKVPSYYYQVLG
jgi:hypothetical protein